MKKPLWVQVLQQRQKCLQARKCLQAKTERCESDRFSIHALAFAIFAIFTGLSTHICSSVNPSKLLENKNIF
jgi:hypothetical protein